MNSVTVMWNRSRSVVVDGRSVSENVRTALQRTDRRMGAWPEQHPLPQTAPVGARQERRRST
jgi:hypothetical protein